MRHSHTNELKQKVKDYTLQHTSTHCNTRQHTATHYKTLQHTATHCNTRQHPATHWKTLQNTATHCNTLHDLDELKQEVKSVLGVAEVFQFVREFIFGVDVVEQIQLPRYLAHCQHVCGVHLNIHIQHGG